MFSKASKVKCNLRKPLEDYNNETKLGQKKKNIYKWFIKQQCTHLITIPSLITVLCVGRTKGSQKIHILVCNLGGKKIFGSSTGIKRCSDLNQDHWEIVEETFYICSHHHFKRNGTKAQEGTLTFHRGSRVLCSCICSTMTMIGWGSSHKHECASSRHGDYCKSSRGVMQSTRFKNKNAQWKTSIKTSWKFGKQCVNYTQNRQQIFTPLRILACQI